MAATATTAIATTGTLYSALKLTNAKATATGAPSASNVRSEIEFMMGWLVLLTARGHAQFTAPRGARDPKNYPSLALMEAHVFS